MTLKEAYGDTTSGRLKLFRGEIRAELVDELDEGEPPLSANIYMYRRENGKLWLEFEIDDGVRGAYFDLPAQGLFDIPVERLLTEAYYQLDPEDRQ